ncbi:mycofactocin precursor MftA [Frankia sp. EAN1pec]
MQGSTGPVGVSESAEPIDEAVAQPLVEEELLIEEVSIDGMCGVY